MVVQSAMLAVPAAVAAAFAVVENLKSPVVLSGILAAAILAVGLFAKPSTLTSFAKLLRPLIILALAAPVLWIALQVVPIPLRGLGNQIWATASAALHQPLAQRFSVDVHETVLALSHYNIVLAAALVTAVVALDTHRAAQVLYILVSITAVSCIFSIWRNNNLGGSWPAEQAWTGSTAAALGVLLSTAMAIRAIDQLRRPRRSPRSPTGPLAILSSAFLSLIISLVAIALCSGSTALIAVLLGVTIILTVVAIRKWFFGLWGRAGVLSTATMLFVASLTFVPINRNADLTIALSTQTRAATERMLQDTHPIGTGAGTFVVLLPIYGDVGMVPMRERPTAAAAVAVEMGRTFLCGLLIVTVISACILFGRALSRNQAYLYPAVGAGACVSLTILAFAENGLFDLWTSLLVATVYGLAFAQSLSGTARDVESIKLRQPTQDASDRATAARRIHSAIFAFPWPLTRVVLTMIGLLLAAQAALMVSQSWPFGDRLSDTSVAGSNEALISAHQSTRGEVAAATVRLKSDKATDPQNTGRSTDLNAFSAVLEYSPLRGDVWLMLAALSKQHAATYDTTSLLRMSYYTAPNALDLIPLRLSVALGIDAAIKDPELRDLIRRDLKVAITGRTALGPAIAAAYQSASADGRALAESSISELDPSYLHKLRSQGP
ncbi:hypothetical protein IVA87_23975 [Bradyrhizobium sp. 147]|uniref:hypothetical protein n=1 Tax=unclassified Bradyrhizobium TaxID=2631580 RepID=UPI001FFA488F|nr:MULTISPECIES: hypothetical protein [unclassified Bradyrhizobium]MCK1682384.1 hypothetical protein [Bradyrhizobium sp. 147]MCK1757031.1 hypothetical protein [Bradyrhizobium sp. 137]